MKRLIFFLVLILTFSACSEFQHLHYRHVKKVPAKGFVKKHPGTERKIAEEKTVGQVDPSHSAEAGIVNEKQDSIIPAKDNNPVYHLPSVLKKQTENPSPLKKIVRGKLQPQKPILHRKGGDGSVFLIVVFLFLGVCLMVIGGTIFVGAFFGFSLWLLLLGLVIFLLGLLPFLGLLSFAFGSAFKKDVPRYDEMK
jgi:hypothetical protein